jgi:hypothetical protein
MNIIPLKTILWQQFGAAIDMFGNALRACPDGVWHARLWEDPSEKPEYSQFWYLAFHTLFWLDLYLSGAVEGFAPPAPFTLDELAAGRFRRRSCLARAAILSEHGRNKCHDGRSLSEEKAHQRCRLSW